MRPTWQKCTVLDFKMNTHSSGPFPLQCCKFLVKFPLCVWHSQHQLTWRNEATSCEFLVIFSLYVWHSQRYLARWSEATMLGDFGQFFGLHITQPAPSYMVDWSSIDERRRGGGASYILSLVFYSVSRETFAMPSKSLQTRIVETVSMGTWMSVLCKTLVSPLDT